MNTIGIEAIQAQNQYLEVSWSDGDRSRYHYMWLRDNCSCAVCGNKSGGHRYLSLNEISSSVKPNSCAPLMKRSREMLSAG